MDLSLTKNELKHYIIAQMDTFFPDKYSVNIIGIDKVFSLAIERMEYCFSKINLKTYSCKESVFFNHLHSDQYAAFLWFLSNTLWTELQDEKVASKLFYLNKVLHGINCLYDTNLPKIFLFIHSIGTVLGKANYSDFFIVSQGCTVGAHNNVYPTLKRGVALLPHASIIGNCNIGERVSVGINATVYSRNIGSDKTVIQSNTKRLITIKTSTKFWGQKFFYEQL